ncbi:MAG: hypothetical protein QXK56_01625 [Sulfolobales archaeon]
MIRTEVEKAFTVKSGSKKHLIEVNRSYLGKAYVVVHEDLNIKYLKGDEVKEWSHDASKSEEVEFKSLPPHIRKAISLGLKEL